MMNLCETGVPKWTSDYSLEVDGCYYEGFVDDYDLVISQHCMESVTTYRVRKSREMSPELMSLLKIKKTSLKLVTYPFNVIATYLHSWHKS